MKKPRFRQIEVEAARKNNRGSLSSFLLVCSTRSRSLDDRATVLMMMMAEVVGPFFFISNLTPTFNGFMSGFNGLSFFRLGLNLHHKKKTRKK